MTKHMSEKGVGNSTNIHLQILFAVTEQLKLPDGKYAKAVERYTSVGEWLNASENEIFKDATIYVQGSVALGTTVKPYGSNEYDIDLVVHLPHLNSSYSSEAVREAIGARLMESEVYKHMTSPLKRGWRINYAGDFHLDITPAIPDHECDNACPINKHHAEFVPDAKLLDWKASNPRGYMDIFNEVDSMLPVFRNSFDAQMALEERTIEDVPDQHEFKGVLKRTVQLLKRHRDIFFNETQETYKEWAPISIIITTLAAHAYQDLIKEQAMHTPIDLMKSIIVNMKDYLGKNDKGSFYLGNPTNLKENFAEKWDESPYYELAFDMWSKAAYNDLESILSAQGLDNVGKVINASFGGNYGSKAIESINSTVSGQRELGVLSGLLALNEGAKVDVAKNTFYGA